MAKMKEVRESNGLLAEKIGPDMMFGTWLDYWYTFYIKPRVRKTTQGSYETAIYDHCIPHLGDIQLKKLTNNDLQQFYTRQKNNGRLRFVEKYGPQLSDRVIRHLHMICHAALDKAVEDRWIMSNPSVGCKIPPKKPKEMRTLTKEELYRFLIQAREEGYYELFLLEISTGLRRGEIVALQWSDLNLRTRELNINKQCVTTKEGKEITEPKTNSSIRTIVLPEPVVRVFREMKKEATSRWIFPSPIKEDSPINPHALGKRFRLILEHSNCKPVRFHDLRHTFATIALQSGMDVKTLSNIIGHVSSATTINIYSHITDTMQRDAACKIDRKITGAEVQQRVDESPEIKKRMEPYIPYKGKIRRPGKGCITEINDHLFEGRYSPTWPDGKRRSHNIYAKTREECEEKLAALIIKIQADIERAREQQLDKEKMSEIIVGSAAKYAGQRKREAIAAYMFEHPEETRKSIIGQAVNADRKTVGKYYDEIRTEIDSTLYKD